MRKFNVYKRSKSNIIKNLKVTELSIWKCALFLCQFDFTAKMFGLSSHHRP